MSSRVVAGAIALAAIVTVTPPASAQGTGGADVVITLDDDCFPVGDPADFVAAHLDVLGGVPRWESTVPGLRVRGLPYGNLGSSAGVELNMGLWKGVPDLDARTTMAAGDQLPKLIQRVRFTDGIEVAANPASSQSQTAAA